MTDQPRIAIAGAGLIGSYLGGALAAGGRSVRLLARRPDAEAMTAHGLIVSDAESDPAQVSIAATDNPAQAFDGAGVILVTTKALSTEDMARVIAANATLEAVVVSLQNGIHNAEIMAPIVAPRRVLSGMVPFNVVRVATDGDGARHVRKATSGTICIEDGVSNLAALLDVPRASCTERSDMQGVLWSKLLVNLNNALNALSGLTLREELSNGAWRGVLARQMGEGLRILDAAGIKTASLEGAHPSMFAAGLRLPDMMFRVVAARVIAIDPLAKSSMSYDLDQRKPTEIDLLHGELLALARTHGQAAPAIQAVYNLIKDAESAGQGCPRLSAEAVEAAINREASSG